MKLLDQIFRYTSDCQFSDDDWKLVLGWCRRQFTGGKIHRAKSPKAVSTYAKFIDWVQNGFKYGDYVGYGKIGGIMGRNVPTDMEMDIDDLEFHSGVFLAAYLDYEGNLIKHGMEIREPWRLEKLDEDKIKQLNKALHDEGLEYYIRSNSINELYTPEKFYYITIDTGNGKEPAIGMYLESDQNKIHFAALLDNGKLEMDKWIDANYAPLKIADRYEIRQLHAATSKQGWIFNERTKQFVKSQGRPTDNVYFYVNEAFDLVMDKDNGEQKHTLRYDAGNYFVDRTEGFMFISEIKKMRGK